MIKVGAKYKMVRHPNTPIGTVLEHSPFTRLVTIAWDNPKLIPPIDEYDEKFFSDGTFVCMDAAVELYDIVGGSKNCFHMWMAYKGFTEDYDYCYYCPAKRYKK